MFVCFCIYGSNFFVASIDVVFSTCMYTLLHVY